MTALPPLDSVKQCPKCGHKYGKGEANVSPGMEWHKDIGSVKGEDDSVYLTLPDCCREQWGESKRSVWITEHLSRICLRCEYRWPEACFVDPEPRLPDVDK